MPSTRLLSLFSAATIAFSLTNTYAVANNSITQKTDRLIIKFKKSQSASVSSDNANSAHAQMLRMGFKPLHKTASGAQVYNLGELVDVSKVSEIAEQISHTTSDVEYAEPDYIMTALNTPDDPMYNQQWAYFDTKGGINAEAAWDLTTGKMPSGESVVVAVVDTGVRPHQDLKNNLLPGYDFISDAWAANDDDGRDDNAYDTGDAIKAGDCGTDGYGNPYPSQDQSSSWHGTHVAGTIAAVGNNSVGVSGVAWNAKVLPIRVLGKCGGYTSDITDGMMWAAGIDVDDAPRNTHPAQVINLSLGGYSSCSRTYQNAIQAIRDRGASIVVAAGNSDDNAKDYTPASCSGVITVAATNKKGFRANYSNYGTVVDVAAPGGETSWFYKTGGILSTLNAGSSAPGEDNYDYYQGTSMAAPHVAGTAALLYAVNPDLSPSAVEQILKSTTRSFPGCYTRGCNNLCTEDTCGTGIIDAGEAVKKAKYY
ncbi:S8 family peptidase [Zooshikella marina]|uniref:S8 family peptidase n=1 Tax=Zooshikella ganghwensis TaxID=202772 RepID=UPI001BB03377|nr:S8 family peptidase [Zooshikella ganghwensis]MBU2706431.1 S8 family peptidase [Zooshikella ganghwensis]